MVKSVLPVALITLAGVMQLSAATGLTRYRQTNLVSNQTGVAHKTDANLVNAWGLAFFPTSPFWVADAGTGVSTLYKRDGSIVPLVVTIPPPAGSTAVGTPTGMVANATADFVDPANSASGPAPFIFDSEDGTISAWYPKVSFTQAVRVVDNSSLGSFYTGLAIGSSKGVNFIYAADTANSRVDMFDKNFKLVTSFTDAALPAGYAPFGIQNIKGKLYVTFAGFFSGNPGGYVDVFNMDGTFIKTFASLGPLNLPWGLAEAPANFGEFSNDLLVGNLGDGTINAFTSGGVFKGALRAANGTPISIDGLWALEFGGGNKVNNGLTNELFFTAGPNFYANGLFGLVSAIH